MHNCSGIPSTGGFEFREGDALQCSDLCVLTPHPPCTPPLYCPRTQTHPSHNNNSTPRARSGNKNRDKNWSNELTDQIDSPHHSVQIQQIIRLSIPCCCNNDPVSFHAEHIPSSAKGFEDFKEKDECKDAVFLRVEKGL